MIDPSPSHETPASGTRPSPLWRTLRNLITGRGGDASLRDQIEEVIDEREGEAASADDLSPIERTMLRNLLHFGERRVDDVAVPRADIVAFDLARSFEDLVELFREAGHSRMPVYRDDLDHVVGMIHIKDVYTRLAEQGVDAVADIEGFMRPVLLVPPSMRVLDLLARMRSGRTHMAIVIDEYGGTDGLVTIEDLVEEIVGDIEDEHDEATEGVQALGDDLYEADARLPVGELEAAVDQAFMGDEIGDDVETVGGLVFLLAGRVPATGEMIVHPSGWRFEVIDGDARHVKRVRVHPPIELRTPVE